MAAATGFVSYAEMWVLRPARYMEATDLHGFRRGRERAKKLFLRARDYAGRALEIRHPGIVSRLLMAPDSVVKEFEAEDIPAMYWFAAAHGRAIWTDLSDAFLVVEAPAVTALLDRALELDEDWNRGALHELYMGIPAQLGGSHEKTLEHFAKAMEENGGMSIGPLVSLAESVHQPRQDREAFVQILNEALAFDPNEFPETRLTNILAQEHAVWLLQNRRAVLDGAGRAGIRAGIKKEGNLMATRVLRTVPPRGLSRDPTDSLSRLVPFPGPEPGPAHQRQDGLPGTRQSPPGTTP